MPISRYRIGNEYSLSDPELYRIAGKDDPEALLEGVAMAGLVGVLRQLGDLAQFASEMFHDLHEEVMSTAGRGHSLIVRVQQLEAEFPSVEKTLLRQTKHTTFLYNSGMDCHPHLRMDQNLVTQQDLPRFVRDSYEECRGPPRLFLLDKFDVAGAGASLKRYTDPSFFKEAPSSTDRKSDEQRERRSRKVKKRGPRWRNGDTPMTHPSSHAKLHQLFLEENIETGGTPEETERRVKLKNRQFSGSLPDQNRGRSYMEAILNAGSRQQKAVDENCVDALALTWPSENGCEYRHEIVESNPISLKESTQTDLNASSLLNMDMMMTSSMDDYEGVYDHENGVCKISSTTSKILLGEESDDGQRQSEIAVDDGRNSDGYASEIDNYLDARAASDHEIETDSEGKNPHYSNLKSVMEDSDTSEGKRKLLSNDAQLNDNATISEDDSTSFKVNDSSSCSISVDALAETAVEDDASVTSVPPVPNFDLDLVKTPVDDHSMTEEVPGNEPADRSFTVEVNENSEIGLSEDYVPVNKDASLQKISLLNEDSDDMYIDAAKPDLTSRIDDGDTNQSAPLSCGGRVAEGAEETPKGHWSHGELAMLDTAGDSSVYPDSSPGLTHTHDGSVDLLLEASIRPDSDGSSAEEHSNELEIVGPVGLTTNMGSCSTSSEELSANHSPAPSFTHCLNFQEQISETVNSDHIPQPEAAAESLHSSPEILVIKEVIADDKNEKEAPSPSLAGAVDTDETKIASVGTPEDEEIRGDSIVTGNLTPLLDFSEAHEHRQQSSNETDVNYDSAPIYSDPVTTVGDSEKSVSQVLQSDASNDLGHDDNHDNESILCDDVTINIPSKLPSNSSYVLPDFGADDLRQDDENLQRGNSTPLSSSSSLNPEDVQEHVPFRKECHQNGEGSSLSRTPLEALKCVDSLQGSLENLDSNPCNLSSDSLAKHLQSNGESVTEDSSTSESNALNVELMSVNGLSLLEAQSLHYSQQIQTSHNFQGLPSVSQLLPQCEHTECSNQSMIMPSNFLGDDTLNGHNRATKGVDNSEIPVYPLGFATLGMLQMEPQINLDSPPLPPLPPMQWRLSRFQNSSIAPGDSSQRSHVTVLEQSSLDEKYGIGEENLSNTSVSMSVESQNVTQLSENGYVAQQGAIVPAMLQSTSMAPEEQVVQHTIGLVHPTPTVLEFSSHGNMKELKSEKNLSSTIPTSVSCHIGTQDPSGGYLGCSESNMSEVKREDDPLSIPTSAYYLDDNQTSERSYQPCGNLHESISLVEHHSCGNSQIVTEAKVDVEVGSQDEHLEHVLGDNKEEVVNSDIQSLPSSNNHPSANLVSPDADRTNDGVQTNADAHTSETVQKKSLRPRNPLIDEVVAMDKSKLRKVERAKSSLELKSGGDSLCEQMQLKKVERVKPPIDGKAEDAESPLEHFQLRKAGERVIPEVKQNPNEPMSPLVQLRKVPKRANTLLGTKSMDRDSLLEQIRTKSFNLKSTVQPRPNLQGPSVQGPRANLKLAAILEKASNIRQAMAGSDEEDDGDSWSDC